jgi:hypothetical protein
VAREAVVTDLLLVGATVAFFAASYGIAALLERL